MTQLSKSVIVKGLENLRQNSIDLLLLGFHNSGDMSTTHSRRDSLIVFKNGTFATINKDEHIDELIKKGHIIDCYYDKDLFFKTVTELKQMQND